jgi:hypothetical protein
MSSLPLTVYSGYDERESVGFHTFTQSLIDTSDSVQLVPINSRISEKAQTDGTNAFTKARFLVPWLNHFNGWALFVDGVDMLLREDVSKILENKNDWKAVHVVKHNYQTKHKIKYVGTSMETDNQDYPCKNWSSVILFNCAHFSCRKLTPEFVNQSSGKDLHNFSWVDEHRLGDLPISWNWLVDEYGSNEKAKLLHWTAGIPGFRHYANSPHSDEWFRTMFRSQTGYQREVA